MTRRYRQLDVALTKTAAKLHESAIVSHNDEGSDYTLWYPGIVPISLGDTEREARASLREQVALERLV